MVKLLNDQKKKQLTPTDTGNQTATNWFPVSIFKAEHAEQRQTER
jgi:hypothetical protein